MSDAARVSADSFADVDAASVFTGRRRKAPARAQALFDRVLFAATQAHREGLGVSVASIRAMNPDLAESVVAATLSSPRMQHALADRGMRLASANVLDGRQLDAVAIVYGSPSGMSFARRLAAAGVSRAEWDGWMREPVFSRYVSDLAEDRLLSAVPVAVANLANLAEDGSPVAIDRVLEIAGRHDRRQSGGDFSALLQGLLLILDDEVRDSGTLQRIGTRLRQLVQAQGNPSATLQVAQRPLVRGVPEQATPPEAPQHRGFLDRIEAENDELPGE